VNATSTATGPAGSSRVIIRATALSTGQPTLVCGQWIPINNATGYFRNLRRHRSRRWIIQHQPRRYRIYFGIEGGTAAPSMVPGRQRVILITTKSGANSKGLGVEYSSTYTAENAINLTDWQYQYGSGSHGLAPTSKSKPSRTQDVMGAPLDGS